MTKTSEWISERLHNPLTVQEGVTFGKRLWFSEQELKDKLKEAEKRIDKELQTNYDCKKSKQILNDCFGVGK